MILFLCFQGGIIYSNKVVVMSPIYSGERLIHSLSYGLEPTLAIHKWVYALRYFINYYRDLFAMKKLVYHTRQKHPHLVSLHTDSVDQVQF